MAANRLAVALYGRLVGSLEHPGGKMRFTYNGDARPISLSMPVRSESYGNRYCEAFFGGLLPEGRGAKQRIAQELGINPNSNFAFLEKIGFDCAGAISIQPEHEAILLEPIPLEGTPIQVKDMEALLEEIKVRPLLAGHEGIRISLAGAQNKAALSVIDGYACFPGHSSPTTHILKPPIEANEISASVQNEHYCMTIAKELGLDAPTTVIGLAGKTPYLLVERYDRRIVNKRAYRVHQEDFCQALGLTSNRKYQVNGGPTLKQSFALLDHTSIPVISRTRLMQFVVFNFLVDNNDAHGKNFSILHLHDGSIALAPIYDVLCTSVYPGVNTEMAMSIGGQSVHDLVSVSNWQKLCKQVGYSFTGLRQLILKMVPDALKEAEETRKAMQRSDVWDPIVDRILGKIYENADRFKWAFE